MYKIIFLFTALVSTLQTCTADTSLRGCDQIEPVVNLNVNNLLGLWYVIQKTSSSSCLSYNFTIDDKNPSQYNLVQIQQHDLFSLSSLHYEDRTTIKVTIPNPSEPGKMNLDIPFSVGTTKMTVFMTDYEHYMGLYFCKQTPLVALAHKWSAEILSRTPIIDMDYVDKVRTRLSSYNIDPFTLSSVSQKDCAEVGEKGAILKAADNIYKSVGDEISNILTDDDGKAVTESQDVTRSI